MSAAVVEMSLTLTSALVGIIITLEDLRQPSKLISCLLHVDRYFFSPLGHESGLGRWQKLAGWEMSEMDLVHPGSQTE